VRDEADAVFVDGFEAGDWLGRDVSWRDSMRSRKTPGKIAMVVDKFESTSERTSGKPMPLENVYAILPGSDPNLAKTLFIVSGHLIHGHRT